MNTLLQRIKSERLYFDGGLGTMLQAKGLAGGEAPEDAISSQLTPLA